MLDTYLLCKNRGKWASHEAKLALVRPEFRSKFLKNSGQLFFPKRKKEKNIFLIASYILKIIKFSYMRKNSRSEKQLTSPVVMCQHIVYLIRRTSAHHFMFRSKLTSHIISRRACGHVDVGTFPHQVLAATLTLSQPVGVEAG